SEPTAARGGHHTPGPPVRPSPAHAAWAVERRDHARRSAGAPDRRRPAGDRLRSPGTPPGLRAAVRRSVNAHKIAAVRPEPDGGLARARRPGPAGTRSRRRPVAGQGAPAGAPATVPPALCATVRARWSAPRRPGPA